jgi:hypothetical protein
MDFHSNLSIGADGVVLRNKHGLSGYSIKEPRNMNYMERIELTRRQLWRGVLRQEVAYGFRQKRSKAEFQNKLMKYARRAGFNPLTAFDHNALKESDLLIGWAGKKLKTKMREKGTIHLGRKAKKVSRRVFKNTMLYFTLRDTILNRKLMPVGELLAEEMTIHELVQITFCRNGKKGNMQLLDAEGKYRTIHWQEVESATQADILTAWAPLQVVKTWSDSTQTEPRPLFRGPRLRPRDPDLGAMISESTIDSSPSQFSPTYLTPPVASEKADEQ